IKKIHCTIKCTGKVPAAMCSLKNIGENNKKAVEITFSAVFLCVKSFATAPDFLNSVTNILIQQYKKLRMVSHGKRKTVDQTRKPTHAPSWFLYISYRSDFIFIRLKLLIISFCDIFKLSILSF